jgi:hypothetical protein
MPFVPPSWVPRMPFDPPDSITVADFMLDEHHGRHPLGYSRPMFTCGLTGKEYSALEVRERVDFLARGLAKELGWQPNKGTEWDKVIAVFSVNTVRSSGLWYRTWLTAVARHTTSRLGDTSPRRYPDAGQRGLQCGRARIPAEELPRNMSLYLRPAATGREGSSEQVRDTRQSHLHLGGA